MELKDLHRYCESPIEVALALEIAAKFVDFEWALVSLEAMEPFEYEVGFKLGPNSVAAIVPQATVSGATASDEWKYRLDFLLIAGRSVASRRAFAIECDGHEWHEKSKAQVARDKRRDRDLILAGIVPVRFSGHEIHKSVGDCVDYIRSLANYAAGDAIHIDRLIGRGE